MSLKKAYTIIIIVIKYKYIFLYFRLSNIPINVLEDSEEIVQSIAKRPRRYEEMD